MVSSCHSEHNIMINIPSAVGDEALKALNQKQETTFRTAEVVSHRRDKRRPPNSHESVCTILLGVASRRRTWLKAGNGLPDFGSL